MPRGYRYFAADAVVALVVAPHVSCGVMRFMLIFHKVSADRPPREADQRLRRDHGIGKAEAAISAIRPFERKVFLEAMQRAKSVCSSTNPRAADLGGSCSDVVHA